MTDVAEKICSINMLVAKLNRISRETFGCDRAELTSTAEQMEDLLKEIKSWCAQSAANPSVAKKKSSQ
jgi:hypothetical protein